MGALTQADKPDKSQALLTLRRLDQAQKNENREGRISQGLKAAMRDWLESEVKSVQRTALGKPR